MFTRCIFCHALFPANGVFGRLPPGRRIAFDPEHGHLWVVCQSCHRWNLCPIEERFEALYELERQVRDEARIVAETDNVTLLTTGELVLIRLGRVGLAEKAWWRYGRELHKRRARFYSTRSQLVAYTYGAMQYVGELVGLGDEDLNISWDDTPVADVLRWRRFGWSAWRGRVNCPFCGSSLRALRYDVSWWVYPRRDKDGRTIVEVPCTRCDPWTPDQVYEIKGAEAENVLRRVLAYQHISGATERSIKDATRIIESVGAGSTEGALERFSTGEKSSLWGMGKAHSMALEIALNDSVEQRMMRAELRSLEIVWKREEELARIIDEELTTKSLFERHLGRLPISVRRAREKMMSASRRDP